MDRRSSESRQAKPALLTIFKKNYAGSITGATLSVLSAWMIVTGLKDAAGIELTAQGALADLAGTALAVGVAFWLKRRAG